MNKTSELSSAVVGERLRLAREEAGKTQAEAAAAIDVARTTLLSIEQGKRRVRTSEVQRLAQAYGTSANALLRHEAVHIDLSPRFRRSYEAESGSAEEDAVSTLGRLVRAEMELEDVLGVRRTYRYPQARPLAPGDVLAQADQDATELRMWLSLGLAPVADMTVLLEMQLGVRTYVHPLDRRISGLFAYDDVAGACILLNANHPRQRRTQTAAHEMGHLLTARDRPSISYHGESATSRVERYAASFGKAFLTPARAVMQKFEHVTVGATKLTRRHVVLLAHFFGVSREAMVRRLEELDLTKKGAWDWFVHNGGITDKDARLVLGDAAFENARGDAIKRPLSFRMGSLAAEASRRGLLSEGQLVRLLGLTREELRGVLSAEELSDDGSGGVSIR